MTDDSAPPDASPAYSFVGAPFLEFAEELRRYNAAIAKMVARYWGEATPVLDYGAGIGTIALLVAAHGISPLCLEPDPRQRAILTERGLSAVASLDDVPDESIGYVYSCNVLEHIEDDVAALRAISAKLRPGGRLFLYVPAFMALYSKFDVALGHHRRYTRRSLSQRLVSSGFTVRELHYTDLIGYLVAMVHRSLRNDATSVNRQSLRTYDRYVVPITTGLERILGAPVGKNLVAVADKSPAAGGK